MESKKKTHGQFYTTNVDYIFDGLKIPKNIKKIVEPFTGQGDLVNWLRKQGFNGSIQEYDIDPKLPTTQKRDTLLNPPDYTDAWIVTNPPYLARNKSSNKDVYDKYNSNDLYKCFLLSIIGKVLGGILIIPAGFFFSSRDIDCRCRNAFMESYRIIHVRYFEETVFRDTTTTVVAFSFERSETSLDSQIVEWTILPSKEHREFRMEKEYDWIIGGDIYRINTNKSIKIRRYTVGTVLRLTEQQTYITLNALDSGKQGGRISLTYKKGYIYDAKECSRTFATLIVSGVVLTEEQQIDLCRRFNSFLEEKRRETHSLFLPQFRESKEYARKRIPFELVYRIVNHLLTEF